MSELTKTIWFAGIAIALALVAVLSSPSDPSVDPAKDIGKPLFEKLTNPLTITSLEIVKPSEEKGKLSRFTVSQSQDGWVIATQYGYPADAKDQLMNVTTAIMNLKILGVVTDQSSQHETYGVLEPREEKDGLLSGMGTMVTLKNQKDEVQARMIIGKKVAQTADQYYVRRATESRVYTVKLPADKLSTKFSDWIEADLLKLDAFDVRELVLHDFVVLKTKQTIQFGDSTFTGMAVSKIDDKSELTFALDGGNWKLTEMVLGEDRKPGKLGENEEPNQQMLNDLKDTLGDLKIVGVKRKHDGIRLDLKTGMLYPTKAGEDHPREIRNSMALNGYWVAGRELSATKPFEVLPDSGEVKVRLKNGVEYRILFGDVASEDDVSKASELGGKDKPAGETTLNHYVMVSANFNEKVFDENEKKAHKDAKKEERDKRKNEALQKVRQLNSRFADWYFIVDDDVFREINVKKDDVIRTKPKEDKPKPPTPPKP